VKNSSSFFYLVLVVFCGFSSCKNKLDLNAPYREIPNVYAVLNPQDRLQIIRINKVFLGEGDANQMAKVADSVNYDPGELTVTLSHSSNTNTIVFRDSVVTTASGAFSTTQRVYVSNEKLATTGIYTLTIKNNITGNTFTSRTTALDSVVPAWHPFTGPYYPVTPGSEVTSQNYINYSVLIQSYSMRFNPNQAKIYQMAMRLHYYDSLGNGNKDFRYIEYVFGNQYEKDKVVSKDAFNGTLVSYFKGQDLLTATGNSLAKSINNTGIYGRRMYKIQFFVFSSTQEYLDYIEFAKPSLNISQQKPLYSNFDNNAAYGIFTFRCRCAVSKNMDNAFITEFQRNKSTCGYSFFNADLSRNTCP